MQLFICVRENNFRKIEADIKNTLIKSDFRKC